LLEAFDLFLVNGAASGVLSSAGSGQPNFTNVEHIGVARRNVRGERLVVGVFNYERGICRPKDGLCAS
jgi:hypothetical protein